MRSAAPCVALDAAAERAQRVEHHARVVANRAGRAPRSCRRPGRRAAARGWRCSSSRAAAPCPTALRSGGRSRKGMSYIGAGVSAGGAGARGAFICQPARPSLAWRSSSSSASALPAQHHLLDRVERLAEALRLLEHFLAVGHQDVAPHRRVAGGDAREVAKARPGQRQQVAPGRLVQHGAEVGEGEQVRQVADRGERSVVVLGRHLQHLRADRGPQVGGPLHQSGAGLRQRRQDHLPAGVQRGVGMLRCPRASLPAIGCAGTKLPMRSRSARRAASTTSRLVLPTSITSTLGVDQVADRLQRGLGGSHRHGEQHDVRTGHRLQRRIGNHVDDAHAQRALGGRRRLAVADDALDERGALAAPARTSRPSGRSRSSPSCVNIIVGPRDLSACRSGTCPAP